MKAAPLCGIPVNSGAGKESPDDLAHYPLARSDIGGFSPQYIRMPGGWVKSSCLRARVAPLRRNADKRCKHATLVRLPGP